MGPVELLPSPCSPKAALQQQDQCTPTLCKALCPQRRGIPTTVIQSQSSLFDRCLSLHILHPSWSPTVEIRGRKDFPVLRKGDTILFCIWLRKMQMLINNPWRPPLSQLHHSVTCSYPDPSQAPGTVCHCPARHNPQDTSLSLYGES